MELGLLVPETWAQADLCLTAAVEGAGVAIARSLLVADAISDGRLVPALATAPDVLSTKVHIARWSPDLIGDRNTQVLVSWLAQAAEETSRGVSNGNYGDSAGLHPLNATP
jgi:LysR family transcriptional regulator, glycine cleavage system transcriptional activator